MQMSSEFLLTFRIDVHVAELISGFEIRTVGQAPILSGPMIPKIYFTAIFSLFVSLKSKSSIFTKVFLVNNKNLPYKLVDHSHSRPHDNIRNTSRLTILSVCCLGHQRRRLQILMENLKTIKNSFIKP